MENVFVTLVCRVADLEAANALCAQFPGGDGTFSIKLCLQGAADLETPTYLGAHGWVGQDMADACAASANPMIVVMPCETTDDFDALIDTIKDNTDAANPVGLRRCVSNEVV